ncbi:MAG: ABC-ATPase domain-containing protein [Acidobacteria bacterium]|nr:ABC-ATPase domain-containing protein [Acidobacteriota bacterium]
MRTATELKEQIQRINGKGYKAYKQLEDIFKFNKFTLFADHIQGDPYAAPSAFRARIPLSETSISGKFPENEIRRTAAEDFLTRLFLFNTSKLCRGIRGTGTSGMITIQKPGQEILKRSSVVLTGEYLEFRFYASLPARGRTILGSVAESMLLNELPGIIQLSSNFDTTITNRLHLHVNTYEDYRALQRSLTEHGLAAFIPDGAILPRKSGIDNTPLSGTNGPLVPFRSPESMEVTLQTPNKGPVCGMGIPKGVTVIAGGGFHGKSTLLNAIQTGVYGHIPLDGREFVATVADAVKIKAEDGRSIRNVNISPFIRNLPFGKDTTDFSTENASGSTSQAANIMEAIEAGTTLLLIDEDTSATNFMIRDEKMKKIVRKEPITPLIDVIRSLYENLGISSIIVTGGAGDYFEVADTVILMEDYLPEEISSKAREKIRQAGRGFPIAPETLKRRLKLPSPRKGNKEKFAAKGRTTLQIGQTYVDISALEQLAEVYQTECIAFILKQYHDRPESGTPVMKDAVEQILRRFEISGFRNIKRGSLALPRKQEIMFSINRARGIRSDGKQGKNNTSED